jgi:transposase
MCTNLQINITVEGSQRGSKVARWILTQIAQAAARKKNSKLKEFINRKKKSIVHAKAVIALQGKLQQ